MSSPGSLGVFLAGGRVILAADPSATLCFPLIEKASDKRRFSGAAGGQPVAAGYS